VEGVGGCGQSFAGQRVAVLSTNPAGSTLESFQECKRLALQQTGQSAKLFDLCHGQAVCMLKVCSDAQMLYCAATSISQVLSFVQHVATDLMMDKPVHTVPSSNVQCMWTDPFADAPFRGPREAHTRHT